MIDWGSGAAGSGAALLKHLIGLFDFMYSIGGSSMTQRVLPAFGFKEVTQTWMGARPLRPVRQMFFHQERNWKLPLRLVRNAWWSVTPPRWQNNGWIAEEASMEDFDPPSSCPRSQAFFHYVGKCPAIRLRLYRLFTKGEEGGWLALSLVQKQARILGIWLKTNSPANLCNAYLAARDAAARAEDSYEISAAGSIGMGEVAAQQAGFRIDRRASVYLLQRAGPPLLPFEFQLVDNDEFFLSGGGPAFLS